MNISAVAMKESTKDLSEVFHSHDRSYIFKSKDFLNGKGMVLLEQVHIQADSSIV